MRPRARLRDLGRGLINTYYRLRLAAGRGRCTLRVGGVRARFQVDSVLEMRRVVELGREKALVETVLGELRPGEVVFDIGANIGTHAIAFARTVGPTGKVVAFEPDRGAAARLRRNVALNGIINVLILERALGSLEGEATLFVDDAHGSGKHSLIQAADRRRVPVRLATGDDLVVEEALPAPNLVKIDVEGSELEVILGLHNTLSSPQCRLVVCEVHPKLLEASGQTPSDVEEALSAAGFARIELLERRDEYHLLAYKPRQPAGAEADR